jgi:hypothetical protein
LPPFKKLDTNQKRNFCFTGNKPISLYVWVDWLFFCAAYSLFFGSI